MPSQTAKWDLPYSVGSDNMDTVDETMEALATRLDVLLGETGETTITPSGAGVATAKAINYSRSYPTAPRVMVALSSGPGTADILLWVTGETVSGFTLNIRASNVSARDVNWVAKPKVTP